LLLGLLIGLGLKVHDGHGLGLEHDLGLGVAQAISLVGTTSKYILKLVLGIPTLPQMCPLVVKLYEPPRS